MTFLIVCQFILGAAMAGYAGILVGRAFDEDDFSYLFPAVLFIILSVVNFNFAISNTNKIETETHTNDKSICEMIPEAQWIADNNTCIKNGKVIL